MRMIIVMFPTIMLVVYSQLITKWRIALLAESMQGAQDNLSRLSVYLKDPYILSSYLAALAGSVAWMFVVERYAISIAFPVYVGLTVLAVTIGGSLLFGEQLTLSKGSAIFLIVVGVAIGSRS